MREKKNEMKSCDSDRMQFETEIHVNAGSNFLIFFQYPN